MVVYRASRRPKTEFDPLDSSASVARDGWRYNDIRTEILYTAGVESLATLEVVARPGWSTVKDLTIAAIEVPDGSVVDLHDIGIVLPSNWNVRAAALNAQAIGAEFLAVVDKAKAAGKRICGIRVPSVISTTDYNVLLDPRQKSSYSVAALLAHPFRLARGNGHQSGVKASRNSLPAANRSRVFPEPACPHLGRTPDGQCRINCMATRS